jgi:hypothetical protein
MKSVRALIFKRDYAKLPVCPADVGFIQYPEFRQRKWPFLTDRTRVMTGDWDQVLDRRLFYGSVYERQGNQQRGMIPLDNYEFFNSLQLRFVEGRQWRETAWVDWLYKQISAKRPVRRYETATAIDDRLAFLDQLYADCRVGNYRQDASDLPVVNIGRQGRIAIDDGRHRMCVAIIAGVDRLIAECRVIHPDAVSRLPLDTSPGDPPQSTMESSP